MKTLMMLLIAMLAGCAQFPASSSLTAEQIAAMVKDKNASAVCLQVIGPQGTIRLVVVNADAGTAKGGVTVNPGQDCSATINNGVAK